MKDCPPIRIFGDLNPGTGYNNAMRGTLEVLNALGLYQDRVRLATATTAPVNMSDVESTDKVQQYMFGEWSGNDRINLVQLNPGMVGMYHTSHEGRWNIAYTTWETNRLPEKPYKRNDETRTIVGDLNEYDEVWVPCRFVADVFSNSGVKDEKLFVVPHALLPEVLNAEPVPAGLSPYVEFYTIGTWNVRKDPGAVVQAYLRCGWNPVSKVNLQVYSVPSTRDPQSVLAHGYVVDDGLKNIKASATDPDSCPSIGPNTTYVPYSKVAQRHAAGDVFVTASHGEGFCLPALEALAMGSWLIGGGPWIEELADVAGRLEDGGPVEVLPSRMVPLTPMPEVKGYELGQDWWTVNHRDLTEAMKDAYAALQEGPSGKGPAMKVREHYCPKAIGQIVGARLERATEVLQESGW
jgi:hypothetical protein